MYAISQLLQMGSSKFLSSDRELLLVSFVALLDGLLGNVETGSGNVYHATEQRQLN